MQLKKSQSEKKNCRRLPIHVYLTYLFTVTFIFTGVTFSKYVTSTNTDDSARVAAFGSLELIEPDKPEKYIITPGVDIVKKPTVNFGVSEQAEMEVYVFVSVNAAGWTYDNDRIYKISRAGTDSVDLLSWSVDAGWTHLADADSAKQVFYRIVPPNGTLKEAAVIDGSKITVSPELLASELKNVAKPITFQAYAVQTQGFDSPESAWASIEGR